MTPAAICIRSTFSETVGKTCKAGRCVRLELVSFAVEPPTWHMEHEREPVLTQLWIRIA